MDKFFHKAKKAADKAARMAPLAEEQQAVVNACQQTLAKLEARCAALEAEARSVTLVYLLRVSLARGVRVRCR